MALRTMAPGGQASMQSLHFVQRSRNADSSTAPGGRSQSVRLGGGACGTTAFFCCLNSWAALATDRTESFRKSRRPYAGSVAILEEWFLPESQNGPSSEAAPSERRGIHWHGR